MEILLNNIQTGGVFLAWGFLWAIGGIWIAHSAFRLRENEYCLVGLAIGLVLENWLANLIGQLLSPPGAFWAAAALVFLIGFGLKIPLGLSSLFKIKSSLPSWVSIFAITYIFSLINRGLAIFDDYAHLPTTSLLAAGNIPPRFALNPEAPYGYHYFLLLFSAQMMRLGDLFPWTALDIARSLSGGLAVSLVSLWVQRITFSKIAGFIGTLFALFGMGTRWLLLLLPKSALQAISENIQMIGSGTQTAPDAFTALTLPWNIEGGGPFAYPFAFISGINQPWALAFGPNGLIDTAIAFPLLLTFNRWKSWTGGVISVILLSSSALISETGLPLLLASWAMITALYMLKNRSLRIPNTLRNWWIVLAAYVVVTLLQGGTWSELFQRGLQSVTMTASSDTYQTIGFQFFWPPTIVSSHLGILSLNNPLHILVALLEIGPVIFMLPLVFAWGIKSFRSRRWYEAALITSGFLSILLLPVQFTGSAGVRNTSRLYSFVGLAALWAVPLVWRWASHRSGRLKALLACAGTVIIFGGVILFGIELIAAQKPVLSNFITPLDARMEKEFWDKLEKQALVFDPIPYRATTILGRYTNSSKTWLVAKPEWEKLLANPDPYQIRASGFDYVYLDYVFWYDIDTKYKEIFEKAPCVQLIREQKDKRTVDFRRLYNVHSCKK